MSQKLPGGFTLAYFSPSLLCQTSFSPSPIISLSDFPRWVHRPRLLSLPNCNMASALLTPWHIQCIHPKLRTDQEKSRYISKVNLFLSEIWHVENDELHQPASSEPVPAMLEVAEVENSQTAYRGASKDAVRVSLSEMLEFAILLICVSLS